MTVPLPVYPERSERPSYSFPLVSGRVPVLPGVRPGRVALRELDDRLRATEESRVAESHLVTERAETGHDAVADCGLDDHGKAVLMPKASGIHRLLHVHAEHEMIDQELRVTLC